MNPLPSPVFHHDRGLGSAYERWHVYRLLDRWASEYDVASALEGPIDGMSGIGGVHTAGLAARGREVTSAVTTAEEAEIVRAVHDCVGGGDRARVLVVEDPMRAADELPRADLVVCYHALPAVGDWRGYLALLASLARKVLVVAVRNPDNWGVAAIRAAARWRGRSGFEAPETWRTDVLAPELWKIGRVREHVYFDAPWWPDVMPGQSLGVGARQLASQARSVLGFKAGERDVERSGRFVYGPEKWPYFGGPGWADELAPALRRHPSFDGASPAVVRRAAHLHAFVVDVRPRTPREKRRLALAG